MGTKTSKAVSVDTDQTVQVDQTFTATSDGGIILKSLFLDKSKVVQTSDIDIRSEGGAIDGALVDVAQTVDAYQSLKVMIKVREKGDTVIVKSIVMAKTKVHEDTDVNVLLNDDGIFDVRETQTITLTQDRDTKITLKADIDLDLVLSQTATIDQDLDVVFSGTPTDFTIAIDADQDAILAQHVGITASPYDMLVA